MIAGVVLSLNVWGAGDRLWRFWASNYARFRLRPLANPLFVRLWFGGLLVVIGAGWIYASS